MQKKALASVAVTVSAVLGLTISTGPASAAGITERVTIGDQHCADHQAPGKVTAINGLSNFPNGWTIYQPVLGNSTDVQIWNNRPNQLYGVITCTQTHWWRKPDVNHVQITEPMNYWGRAGGSATL